MGLGGTYSLKDDFKLVGKPQRNGNIFYGGSWPLETPCKNFNSATGGGLGWIKWLKDGAGKGFIFHAIIPALYPVWLNIYWLS